MLSAGEGRQKYIEGARASLKAAIRRTAELSTLSGPERFPLPPPPKYLATNYPPEQLPDAVGENRLNAAGIPYLYCAFDLRKTNATPDAVALAVIDPGPDGKYNSFCTETASRYFRGDDLGEVMSLADLRIIIYRPPSNRKLGVSNCAFGQIYIINTDKNIWECIDPAAWQQKNVATGSIPAGCPPGQALVAWNNQVACRDMALITGQSAATPSSPGPETLPPAMQAPPAGTAASSLSTSSSTAPALYIDRSNTIRSPAIDPAAPLPRNSGTDSQAITQLAPPPSKAAQPNSPAIMNADNSVAGASRAAGGKIPSPAAVQTGVLVDSERQAAAEKSKTITAAGAASPATENKTRMAQNSQNIAATAASTANPSSVSSNYTASGEAQSPAAAQSRVRQPFILDCKAGQNYRRCLGVQTQCIRANPFAPALERKAWWEMYGAAFAQGNFFICDGKSQSCRFICLRWDADLSQNYQGYYCAYLLNPMPTAWPAFDGFTFRDFIDGKSRCSPYQVPVAGKQRGCLNVSLLAAYPTNGGACSCGQNLQWNPGQERSRCF